MFYNEYKTGNDESIFFMLVYSKYMHTFFLTCHQIPGGTSEDIAKEGAVIPTCDAANVDFCKAI